MVDMDKHACHQLTENGYKNSQWPESYITWEFLTDHPRAMGSRYFHIDWNSIPGLYNQKPYLRILVIEKEELDHLSDPSQLEHYWEPTQNSDDFHQTLGLALCWTPFHDCSEPRQKKEYIMSVAVVRKLAWHLGLPFTTAAEELQDNTEMTPTLLLIHLHRKSQLFPDIYYDRCRTHFTLMHDTGKGYNVGDPQKFLRALLHNAVTSGKEPSPKAKLPPVYLDLPATSHLIDSCTRKYRDWMEKCPAPEGGKRAAPEEHFVWLSKDYTPYDNDPGSPFIPPDFTLGLPPVKDWPCRASEAPWVLDPNGHPKPVRNIPVDSTSSMGEGKKKKKKKKKDRPSKKTGNPELKVTTRGEGADMMGIPQESAKAGLIKCRYVIYVLRSVEGLIIDAHDSDYGRDWNIGLYDIVSPASTRKVEKSGSLIYKGRVVQGKVTYGYCPFCSYASTNHRTLNNHIWMHLRLTLACGMKDCWFVTHSSDLMWKHAASHGLTISEPIATSSKKK